MKLAYLFASVLTGLSLYTAVGAERQLVLIAGKPSHPPGMHEFRAGCLLLQKCLAEVPGLRTTVYTNGWPSEDALLVSADAIVIYADGGGGHPAIQGNRLKLLQSMIEKGMGFGVMHYACEVPKDKGGQQFLDWVGGYYEDKYSCNPIWSPEYKAFSQHPVTRGLQPFSIKDEWYFNMRWREGLARVTPILVAKPSDQVRDGPYVWPAGPYPHIQAAKGRDETMMWVSEQGNRRAFGFTGGHFHDNWANDNFRKVILNAMVWVSGMEVPEDGVNSSVAPEQLKQNLDPKKK
jgi:type 1 glutamine amidotransferase